MPTLFDPIRLGQFECSNRIFMSPLTRSRASREGVPSPLVREHYAQRATAGLIISEAVGVTRQGLGWPFAPGIWNQAQVSAWRPVTREVHAHKGRIIAQLWHMGRLVHPDYLGGTAPVSSWAIAAPDNAKTYEGPKPYAVPHMLNVAEIKGIIADYVHAAKNAMSSEFDGIQLHAANGYLFDQFMRDSCNQRSDDYGGTPEKRTRFIVETVQAIADAIGADRVAIRVSPAIPLQGCVDSAAEEVFTRVAEAMRRIGIMFLEVREPAPNLRKVTPPPHTTNWPAVPLIAARLKAAFKGPFVVNTGYDRTDAMAAVANGEADAIAFGKPFISNPDLVARLANNRPLAQHDLATLYTQGAEGYTSYPAWKG